MKHLVVILILLSLTVGCHRTNKDSIQVLSYFWRIKSRQGDTLVPFIRPYSFTVIDNDGICLSVRSFYQKPNEFQDFIINRELLNDLKNRIKDIDDDTTMVIKCNSCIYDGPSIDLIFNNRFGKRIVLGFINSERSDKTLFTFYNYLDSLIRNENTFKYRDSSKFLNMRDSLVNITFNRDIRLIPQDLLIVRDSIKFNPK